MNEQFEAGLVAGLARIRSAGTYKQMRTIVSATRARVRLTDGTTALVLSSNDYLGLANDPDVIEAGVNALHTYGAGAASVRFICGTFDVHERLEARIAAFFGFEAALTYASCWAANEGLLPVIGTEDRVLVSDELNHASIIDACRLAKAQRLRYRHSDMTALNAILAAHRERCIVVTDGVFSMEGDVADVPAIVKLAEMHRAAIVIDDSHGTGVFGATGAGVIEHFGLTGRVDILTGTLGKALGGAAGGFVAGSRAMIETLVQQSRTQLFSNAIPASVAAAAHRAIDLLEERPDLLRKQRDNAAYFRARLLALGFQPVPGDGAIIPIIVGATAFAIRFSDLLLERGVMATGFGYPVVPEGTARIRVQMSARLERDDLDFALAAFADVGRMLEVIP